MEISKKYVMVVGLEVHAQLLTKSKAFAPDPNLYGSPPNTNVSPITLGHPGTLPQPNRMSLELALRMGIALKCTINRHTHFARKNYFYADLPKGYQITQFPLPVCTDGQITIKDADGNPKNIFIEKIILEEDSGKSIHDIDPFSSLVDLNRAGVPLIEIVTGPDMRHPKEAYNYLTEIRKLVRYLDICDGNMEEGSLRCDANVSLRPRGQKELGTKVEVKNMNSIRHVQRALEYEIERQQTALENGEPIYQETRNFDAVTGTTVSMRGKEMAHDYRYFPEPDIPPIVISLEQISKVEETMPELPAALHEKFIAEYGLSEYDATILTSEKNFAHYFMEVIEDTEQYKAATNWMIGPVRSYTNEQGIDISEFMLKPAQIAELVELVEAGKMNFSIASTRLFSELMKNPEVDPERLAEQMNLIQEGDEDLIRKITRDAIAKYPQKAADYRAGKKNLLGMFMGEIMRASKGKADPKKASRILTEELENQE
ncbi:MAG: Asp-tRNA(Asn)/Glu-tRNA(Gln) amidotransferase subunit GatB [Bacteroidia bacterium]